MDTYFMCMDWNAAEHRWDVALHRRSPNGAVRCLSLGVHRQHFERAADRVLVAAAVTRARALGYEVDPGEVVVSRPAPGRAAA